MCDKSERILLTDSIIRLRSRSAMTFASFFFRFNVNLPRSDGATVNCLLSAKKTFAILRGLLLIDRFGNEASPKVHNSDFCAAKFISF